MTSRREVAVLLRSSLFGCVGSGSGSITGSGSGIAGGSSGSVAGSSRGIAHGSSSITRSSSGVTRSSRSSIGGRSGLSGCSLGRCRSGFGGRCSRSLGSRRRFGGGCSGFLLLAAGREAGSQKCSRQDRSQTSHGISLLESGDRPGEHSTPDDGTVNTLQLRCERPRNVLRSRRLFSGGRCSAPPGPGGWISLLPRV